MFWRKGGASFPVSYTAAPVLAEGGETQGAVVTFSDISERRLLEQERARIAEREHRIAAQLQEALQPAIPKQVPGLELADYYKAALEEAGVGGDFLDVFAADKGVTFLVVGDLSGKGLAAASQVAVVRNMLRFALYNGRTLSGPVTTLSRTLADNDLLSGFATLFVGRYEAAGRRFSYVNCGQDAGLVLRAATGQTVTLPPNRPGAGRISRSPVRRGVRLPGTGRRAGGIHRRLDGSGSEPDRAAVGRRGRRPAARVHVKGKRRSDCCPCRERR